MQPFFSIVIPTKNRPKLVEAAIFSLSQQSFKNFEVIISDYEPNACKNVFDKYADDRFRYVSPSPEFKYGMNGNWEFGLRFAQGRYICILEDKMYLYQNSLEIIYRYILEAEYPDTVNWHTDLYKFEDEQTDLKGCLRKRKKEKSWKEIDILQVIAEKIEFSSYMVYREVSAGIGTIFSGMIKREVIENVKKRFGRYFDFYNPDYGSAIPNLFFSQKSILLGAALTIALQSIEGNGRVAGKYYTACGAFFEESLWGYERLKYSPAPFLRITYMSTIGADYNYALSVLPELQKKLGKKACNRLNALIGIKRDFDKFVFPNQKTREEEEHKFNRALRDLSYDEFEIFQRETVSYRNAFEGLLIKNTYASLVPGSFKIETGEYIWKRFNSPMESVSWI